MYFKLEVNPDVNYNILITILMMGIVITTDVIRMILPNK